MSAKKTATKKAAAPETKKAPKLAVGAKAPDFTLTDQDGKAVKLSGLRGKKVVLYFYPKDDTPGCTREACGFNEQLDALDAKGAVVVGVSRDGAATHQKFRAKYGLRFALLTDADRKVHDAYGAWGKKVMYGKETEGVVRTTVLVDEAGVVTKLFSGVKVDGHTEAVLGAL